MIRPTLDTYRPLRAAEEVPMDVTTKLVVLAVIGLIILVTLLGEFRGRVGRR